jgi:hypothetical protein
MSRTLVLRWWRQRLVWGSMPLQRALQILIPDGKAGDWLLPPSLHLRGLARLEHLGAVILLLRLAQLYGCEDEIRSSLTVALFEWLMILGIELHERGVAADVFGLCFTRILPFVSVAPPVGTMEQLAAMSALLNISALHERADDAAWNWDDRLDAMTTYIVEAERRVLAEAVQKIRAAHEPS